MSTIKEAVPVSLQQVTAQLDLITKDIIEEYNTSWKDTLEKEVKKDGSEKFLSSITNVEKILLNDELLLGMVRHNLFTDDKEIYHKPYWRKEDDTNRLWIDADEAFIKKHLYSQYKINASKDLISQVLSMIFYRNQYHPVKEYLSSLEWDGLLRVEKLFVDFLGAEDYYYTHTITRNFLVGAVKRIFEKGSKHDEVPILVGGQGIGKSTIANKLAKGWFLESMNSFSGDEALKKLRGAWIVEIAELSAMKKNEVEEVKGFLSATNDRYRGSYDKYVREYPRECVFIGTTNDFEFLKDSTGNRRFLPVQTGVTEPIKDIFTDLSEEYVNQVWAEAVMLYKSGIPTHYQACERTTEEAKRLQGVYTLDDSRVGEITAWLDDRQIQRTCAREILSEIYLNDNPSTFQVKDIVGILKNLDGWKMHTGLKSFGKYGKQRNSIERINKLSKEEKLPF